eukprot:3242336-Rhodomonas_salina.4
MRQRRSYHDLMSLMKGYRTFLSCPRTLCQHDGKPGEQGGGRRARADGDSIQTGVYPTTSERAALADRAGGGWAEGLQTAAKQSTGTLHQHPSRAKFASEVQSG